jgi:hypothetical protein
LQNLLGRQSVSMGDRANREAGRRGGLRKEERIFWFGGPKQKIFPRGTASIGRSIAIN